ncbi:hypothetical protein B0T26DRAFT_505594 [Lasiosphaeria miniovina]|uniref:Secreted protein n=1 Tax=Lasiosphaeria miniovina TaxID=1954250 RepID=A0AA39ZU12_9PEZI|nr:uncharacterized protein B0T26DRAFT_505594 [Lasiosphaeria miniovina]KAK0703568.1 hypothetical protein B0T26DRAFT_505594 [Lasiosphaeria miniovina]
MKVLSLRMFFFSTVVVNSVGEAQAVEASEETEAVEEVEGDELGWYFDLASYLRERDSACQLTRPPSSSENARASFCGNYRGLLRLEAISTWALGGRTAHL